MLSKIKFYFYNQFIADIDERFIVIINDFLFSQTIAVFIDFLFSQTIRNIYI